MRCRSTVVFVNDAATTEIYTLSLHDALPISAPGTRPSRRPPKRRRRSSSAPARSIPRCSRCRCASKWRTGTRSEEHTSELQSRQYLVCRLLLEKTKRHTRPTHIGHRLIVEKE